MSLDDQSIAARKWRLPSALWITLILLVYAHPLFTHRTFTGRDQTAYNLPMAWSIHDAYARARLPVWTAEISGGRPLLPNPNVGALYPVRPALSRLPFPLAMRLYPVLHWAAAGIGMILFLTSLGGSQTAAWMGAVTYVFSGVGVSEVFFPHLQPGMTLLPWVLWGTGQLQFPNGPGVLGLAILFTLDFLAGDIFTAALAIGCAVLWIFFEAARGERRSRFLALGESVGLGVLAAAPQIVATALWIPETHRAVTGMNLAEATGFSLSPWRMLELAVPFPFGESWRLEASSVWGRAAFAGKPFGFFLTLYSGAFAAVALCSLWKSRDAAARFGRCLFLLAAAVSILPGLLPRAWGRIHSPLPLRNPEKLSVALVLGLAILSARAWDVFRAEHRRPKQILAVAVILTVGAVGCTLFPGTTGRVSSGVLGGIPRPELSRQLSSAFAEAGLLWIMTLVGIQILCGRQRSSALAACCLLTAVPLAANRRIPQTSRDEEVFAPTPFARRIERADPRGEFRTLGESLYRPPAAPLPYRNSELALAELPRRSWIQYGHLFWGRGTLFNEDFDTGDLSRMESLRQVSVHAATFRDSAVFFQNLALRWGIRDRGQVPVAGFRRFDGDAVQDWDELEGALPDIRLATRWAEEPNPLHALNRIGRLGLGEVVLETGRAASGAARRGNLRVLERTPEHLRIEVEAPDPTWLFVLRAFWSYRTVAVDGRATDPVPADLALTAVPVPAGRSVVDWKEEVPGGRASVWGLAVAALAGGGIALRRRNRRIS